MTFDPKAARKAVLPAIEDKMAKRSQIYSQMINDLRLAIDAALETIARNNYEGGGTIIYESSDFSDRREIMEMKKPPHLATRVAWIFSQHNYTNDGITNYETYFVDEDRNLTTTKFGSTQYPFQFTQMGVTPLFHYDSANFNGWDIAPRLAYPTWITETFKNFCRNGVTGPLPQAVEYRLFQEYGRLMSYN